MIDYTCDIWWDTFDMGIPFTHFTWETFSDRVDNPWF
jgi:hypothetical protein